MPERKLHNRLNLLLLGDSFSDVSENMDSPYRKFGRRHRNLRHDSAFILEMLTVDGLGSALGAWLHLVLDYDRELAEMLETYEGLRLPSASPEGQGSRKRVRRGR